jgi:hypothetical protein
MFERQMMKTVMLISMLIFITLYLMFGAEAKAAEEKTATLRWVNPTQYVDGSPLDVTRIRGYHIYWEEGVDPSPNNPSTSRITLDVPEGGVIPTSYEALFMMQPRPEPYVYHFRISVFLDSGIESAPSNVAIKDFGVVKSSAPPNAPTGLTAE